MRKFFSIFLIVLALGIIPFASNAQYSSDVCKAKSGCTAGEVGPFMQTISQACGNLGDCTLVDIMKVFMNTGNFILGIVGGLVLFMYVIGGFYMLSSGGKSERVTKGKKYLQVSTVGLLIVMFGYLGIFALKGTITGGGFSGDYALCDYTDETNGKACGLNSTCTPSGCTSQCDISYKGSKACIEVDPGSKFSDTYCTANQCPGSSQTMCCSVTSDDAAYEKLKQDAIDFYKKITK
jgi:hypothetical protein